MIDEKTYKRWNCSEEGYLVNEEESDFHPENANCMEAEETNSSTHKTLIIQISQ